MVGEKEENQKIVLDKTDLVWYNIHNEGMKCREEQNNN
jgi:hypothetical protein